MTSHPSSPPRSWPNGSISRCSGPRKQKPWDVALVQALQDNDIEGANILHEAVRHLTDRLFTFRRRHRDVVPYGILREVGHDLVKIQPGPGGEQVANHFFTIDRHSDVSLKDFYC